VRYLIGDESSFESGICYSRVPIQQQLRSNRREHLGGEFKAA